MSQLRLLSADEADKLDIAWPDVYFSPAYGRVSQFSDNARWELAIWTTGPILFPYLKRAVDGSVTHGNWFDVVSPYGYSGFWAPDDLALEQWRRFRRRWRALMRKRGCVAEFLRLNALLPSCRRLAESDVNLSVTTMHETVAVHTGDSYQSYWESAQGRCRTSIRKARRLGYHGFVRAGRTEDFLPCSHFRVMYEQSMRRVDSAAYYRFNDQYFQQLYANLHDKLFLCEVRNSTGELVFIGVIIKSPPFVHLHLIGSQDRALRDGAGNLGYDTIIQWACGQVELSTFHLGGGLRRNDNLFRFKKSFGGQKLPFRIAKSIVNQQAYDFLIQQRSFQIGCTVEDLISHEFFPAYRCHDVGLKRAA